MNADFPFKAVRRRLVCDTECAHGYWLLKFKDIESNVIESFAIWPGSPMLDVQRILFILASSTIITFNGNHYDLQMIALALTGADTALLKQANDAIIVGGVKPWTNESTGQVGFYDLYRCSKIPNIDHIDIMEVAPGVRISLKTYMGAVHSMKMQDLPFDPDQVFGPFDRLRTADYCDNDLAGTIDLYRKVEDRVTLRESLNEQYRKYDQWFDARSKSDAQIAEAVFKARILPLKVRPRFVPHGYQFYYQPPAFIKFKSPELQAILRTVCENPFTVTDKDQWLKMNKFTRGEFVEGDEMGDPEIEKIKTGVIIPDAIKAIRYRRGVSTYKFGMGGLHSQEKSVHWHSVPNSCEIEDDDVESYYPTLILMMGMYPEAVGLAFLQIYREIYDTRIHAKHQAAACKAAGDKEGAKHWKTIADGLKIVLNGTFGKLGSKYSVLFSPEQMIQVTLTGQLALLMLIEELEDHGITVVSANTDGIVTKVPDGLQWLKNSVIKQWEASTGLKTERTNYAAIYMQSVNSYVAFKKDGEVKTKGFFAEPGVSNTTKVPARAICADAAIAFLKDGTPITKTVRGCKDIRRFVTVRNVKGGAVKYRWSPQQLMLKAMGEEPFEFEPDIKEYLGKVVRYVYGKGEPLPINYKENGKKVADSDGAVPVMQLPADFAVPDWIDHARYEEEAVAMLQNLGVQYV
jgi:hypothetical protein